MYQPKLASRERILFYGPAGSGKSDAAYSLAKRIIESGNTVFVVDNDYSYARQAELDPPANASGLILREAYPDDWSGMMGALEQAVEHGQRDDLLIIDSMTPTWQAAQEWYTEQVFGSSMDEFFLNARKEMKGNRVEGFDGWKDWSVINKVYGVIYRMITRFPGHVVLTAELENMMGGEDQETVGVFGPYRTKPRGQKRLPHTVNTIVMLKKDRAGSFRMTVVKDRGRERGEKIEDEEFDDFFMDYMVGVAGWRNNNG
jgi:energy-coupling factor transporter ATP-binding protein EcfA2